MIRAQRHGITAMTTTVWRSIPRCSAACFPRAAGLRDDCSWLVGDTRRQFYFQFPFGIPRTRFVFFAGSSFYFGVFISLVSNFKIFACCWPGLGRVVYGSFFLASASAGPFDPPAVLPSPAKCIAMFYGRPSREPTSHYCRPPCCL